MGNCNRKNQELRIVTEITEDLVKLRAVKGRVGRQPREGGSVGEVVGHKRQ